MRPQSLQLILPLFLMCCQSSKPVTEPMQFLYFDGCPNTPLLYDRLIEACPDATVERVDLTQLEDGDPLLGWGAPTILIGGKDLFDVAPSASKSISCRNWSHGLPSVHDIEQKVTEAN